MRAYIYAFSSERVKTEKISQFWNKKLSTCVQEDKTQLVLSRERYSFSTNPEACSNHLTGTRWNWFGSWLNDVRPETLWTWTINKLDHGITLNSWRFAGSSRGNGRHETGGREDIDREAYLFPFLKILGALGEREELSSVFQRESLGVACERKGSRAINSGSGAAGRRDIIFALAHWPPLLISSRHETSYSFPLCRLIRRIYGALIQSRCSRSGRKKGEGKNEGLFLSDASRRFALASITTVPHDETSSKMFDKKCFTFVKVFVAFGKMNLRPSLGRQRNDSN